MAKKELTPVEEKTKILPRQVFIAVALAFIVAGSIYVLTSFATKLFYEAPRAARVHEIYDSLQLSATEFIYQGGAIAGERRLYKDDGTRSWSSYAHYLRGADVDTTVDELNRRITSIGFKEISRSDDRAAAVEIHYENDKSEFVRVIVHSKVRQEYFQNAELMGRSTEEIIANAVDPNAGPSKITIKVNLDNNNE